jgi:phosphate uptake regulator
MEQRKLIAQGPSSVTISLPHKWITEHNLQKGSVVYIDTELNKLIITAAPAKSSQSITLSNEHLDKIMIIHLLQAAYRASFDEITLNLDQSEVIAFPSMQKSPAQSVAHYMVGRFVGLEVVEQNAKQLVIKRITQEDSADFEQLLRRIFLLILELSNQFYEIFEKNQINKLELIKEQHDYINNLTNYCLRILIKQGYNSRRETMLYYHIIASLDKIVDFYKYVADDKKKVDKKVSPHALHIISQLQANLRLYYEIFYKYDQKKLSEFNKRRWEIKKSINTNLKKLTSMEIMYVTRLESINEILLDITESRIALELCKS